MHAVLRNRLRGASRTSTPRKASVTAIKRLDDQLARARRLFEYGEYDWDTFCARREEIGEQQRQLERSAAEPEAVDLAWCESQLLDLTSAWETADSGQRSRLALVAEFSSNVVRGGLVLDSPRHMGNFCENPQMLFGKLGIRHRQKARLRSLLRGGVTKTEEGRG